MCDATKGFELDLENYGTLSRVLCTIQSDIQFGRLPLAWPRDGHLNQDFTVSDVIIFSNFAGSRNATG